MNLKDLSHYSCKSNRGRKNIHELHSASFQGVERLFVLAYFVAAADANNEADIKSNRNCFLPRGEIRNYNVLTDGRNFYVQPVNDLVKQYDEVRKVSTGHGDDYTTGCLLDYVYLKDNYRLVAVGLNKQKALDADSRQFSKQYFQVVLEEPMEQK